MTGHSAALAALLAEVPGMLKDAQFACEITGFDRVPDEALEYHDRVLRDLRDWLIELAMIVAPVV